MCTGISSNLIATLGNSSSPVPLFVKDTVNALGSIGTSKKAGGNIEAQDRLIDEFGTQAIWLMGLPVFKTIFDLTAYKLAKQNPNVDIRLFTKMDSKVLNFYKSKAKDADLKSIEKAAKSVKTFKWLSFGKVAFATLATIFAYNAIAGLRNHITKENVKNQDKNDSQTKLNDVSFSGSSDFIQSFALDPVRNMMLVDVAISGGRLFESRNKNEALEFALSEGAFWLCMYLLSDPVKNGLEYISDKVFNRPVKLDIRALTSKDFYNSLDKETLISEINNFKKASKAFYDVESIKKAIINGENITEFIDENKDNEVVKLINKENIDSIQNNIANKKGKKFDLAKILKIDENKLKDLQTNAEINTLKFISENENNLVVKLSKATQTIKTTNEKSFFNRLKECFEGKRKISKVFNPCEPKQINWKKFIDVIEVKDLADNMENFQNTFKNSNSSLKSFIKTSQGCKVTSVLGSMAFCCAVLGGLVPNLRILLRKYMQGSTEFHVANDLKAQLNNNENEENQTLALA